MYIPEKVALYTQQTYVWGGVRVKVTVSRVKSMIGVDLAGLLGGRMASAEGGSVSSGVAYGEGCPLSSRLRGLGERRELPQRGLKTDFGVF